MPIPLRSCLLLALSATATVWAQAERALPDRTDFLRQLRSNLQSARLLQRRYAYREKRIDIRRDETGAEIGRTEKVFDVYPVLKRTEAYRRLVSVDGVPSGGANANDAEADHRRWSPMLDRARQVQNETPAQREMRLRDEAQDRRKEDEIVDDAFCVFSFYLTGREELDGHETITFTFAPVPGATPRTSEGKLLQKFSGRAWVAERDHQLMRLEVEATDDVSFGFGLLARLHKGSQVVFERRPVNDVWLPSELRYSGDARVLLLKKLRLEGIREYSDYRAFSLGTIAAVSPLVR